MAAGHILEGCPGTSTSHGWHGGEGCAADQGFLAAPSEGQNITAAFSQGRLQGCEAILQPRVPRAVLQSRVPAPQGDVCWARDSAVCQGQLPACPGSSPQCCGEKLWVEGVTIGKAGQNPPAVNTVLCESGLLTAPDHPQDICRGSFGGIASRQHLPESEGVCALSFLLMVGWVGSGRWEYFSPLWRRHGDPSSC